MRSKKLLLLTIASVAILAGCNTKKATQPETNNSTVDTQETTDQAIMEKKAPESTAEAETMTAVEGEQLVIDMTNFKFSMPEIKVKAGTTLKIKLTNSQGFHDFVIDDLDVKTKQLKEGEETEIEIVIPATDAGESYEYYCSVGQHKDMGMKGMLIVE